MVTPEILELIELLSETPWTVKDYGPFSTTAAENGTNGRVTLQAVDGVVVRVSTTGVTYNARYVQEIFKNGLPASGIYTGDLDSGMRGLRQLVLHEIRHSMPANYNDNGTIRTRPAYEREADDFMFRYD